MTDVQQVSAAPVPIAIACQDAELDALLTKEWVLTNDIGAYASSTVTGCNTRRYHGLLVAALTPPVGRVVALATVMETLTVGQAVFQLATNEFAGTFAPRGVVNLTEFRNAAAATFVYRAGGAELVKEVLLAEKANAVAIRYRLSGSEGTLRLDPFFAMRDYHHLRRAADAHQMTFERVDGGVAVQDRMQVIPAVHCVAPDASFETAPQWWYRFCYRVEMARGQDCFEDLYTPGGFTFELADGQTCLFTASLDRTTVVDFDRTLRRRRDRMAELAGGLGDRADDTARRLAEASDAFIVQRSWPNAAPSATILAGYHWFADWGRDAFVALPGLLLATKRFDKARDVFRTFADHMADGMMPNRFDDYSATAHYNSIDASLWFIIAAERYFAATGDTDFWCSVLMPASIAILAAYRNGTRFDIRADADGLLIGGSHGTQLTWMDAKLGGEVVTPRHGKAVEVNALWHSAHRIMADRCRGVTDEIAASCAAAADMIARAFVSTFWNDEAACLFDCVSEGGPDTSLRPNQVLAVSLPHSPLSHEQQAAVVRAAASKLLTPYGLRTLSLDDPRYRRRYGGSWESRDRAYHQGTVWAWLMGPFIEAYLKVEGPKPFALEQAKTWLSAFDEHLTEAGLGTISEIFDADAPHRAHGCIAQAWSVAEVLRAKQLIAEYQQPD